MKRENKRLLQLKGELKDKHKPRCKHGYTRYPKYWMEKTQEKALEHGYLIECKECVDEDRGYRYLMVGLPGPEK